MTWFDEYHTLANKVAQWTGDHNRDGTADPLDRLLQHNMAFASTPAYAAAPFRIGQAFDLNGTSEFLETADADDLDPGSGALTVEGWFQSDGLTGFDHLLNKGNGVAGADGYCILLDGNGDTVTARCSDGANDASISKVFVDDLGTHHVAIVVDVSNGTLRAYLDGVAFEDVGDITAITSLSTLDPLRLGAAQATPSNFLNAKLWNWCVWNVAKSAEEIALIAAGPQPLDYRSPEVARFDFSEGAYIDRAYWGGVNFGRDVGTGGPNFVAGGLDFPQSSNDEQAYIEGPLLGTESGHVSWNLDILGAISVFVEFDADGSTPGSFDELFSFGSNDLNGNRIGIQRGNTGKYRVVVQTYIGGAKTLLAFEGGVDLWSGGNRKILLMLDGENEHAQVWIDGNLDVDQDYTAAVGAIDAGDEPTCLGLGARNPASGRANFNEGIYGRILVLDYLPGSDDRDSLFGDATLNSAVVDAYFVGNSHAADVLADDSDSPNTPALAAMARQRGRETGFRLGFHVHQSNTMAGIASARDGTGSTVDPRAEYGYFAETQESSGGEAWNNFVFQPYENGTTTYDQEVAGIQTMLDLLKGNPKIWILATWPRGSDMTAPVTNEEFMALWDATETITGSETMKNTRQGFQWVHDELVSANPDRNFGIIWCGEALYNVAAALPFGTLDNVRDDFYRDTLHLDLGIGRYLTALTAYCAITGDLPGDNEKPAGTRYFTDSGFSEAAYGPVHSAASRAAGLAALDPGVAKPSLINGASLKPSLLAADGTLKPSLLAADGTLKPSWSDAGDLKPSQRG